MTLLRNQVRNLELDDYIITDISNYNNTNFLPLSGGTITNNLSIVNDLSVNGKCYIDEIGSNNTIEEQSNNFLIVGSNNNMTFSNYSYIFGYGCSNGSYGYKILSGNYLNVDKLFELSIDTSYGEIDDAIVGLRFSIATTNATTDVGTVLSVIHNNSTIIVDKLKYNVADIANKEIYFISDTSIGNKIITTAGYSFNSGLHNQTLAYYSHAEGRYNAAAGNYAHVEGKQNTASWGSHAEGCSNRALGECSHATGRVNTVRSPYSMAVGSANRIEEGSGTSFAAGYLSRAKDPCSFVWNGQKKYGYRGDETKPYNYTEAGNWSLEDSNFLSSDVNYMDKRAMEYMDSNLVLSSMYESNGSGTFNINPANGLSGFYIGTENLHDILNRYMASITPGTNIKPLAGKEYNDESSIRDMIIDIITALGGTYIS